MAEHPEDLGSFFKENAALLREYIETRMKIYRLQIVRILSRSAGNFLWIIISLFLIFLFLIFLGVVVSLLLSKVTGSYIAGFGITTGAIFIIIIVIAFLRKPLFINPIIKSYILRSEEKDEEKESTND